MAEVLPQKEAVYKYTPRFTLTKKQNVYEVSGEEIERIVAMTDFNNQEAVDHFQKI